MDTRSQRELAAVIKRGLQSTSNQPVNQWTLGLVHSRLYLLESYWDDFQANHVAILHEAEEVNDDPYFTEGVYHEAETDYVTTKGLLFDIQARLQPGTTNVVRIPDNQSSISTQSRLPKITIPQFNGDRQQWESFKDLYRSLIHSDPTLKDVDKLYYLKTLVSGEALTAIQTIPITGDSYATAWSTLETRYGNKYLLVQSHLISLKRLRHLKEESLTELQKLIDELRRHREQLRALGRPVDHWDDWFVSIATDTMDSTTRRDWEEELQRLAPDINTSNDFYPTFTQLFTFLERRCRTLKSLEFSRSRPTTTPSKSTSGSTTRQTMTAVTMTAKCAKCEGPHYTGHCEIFQKLTPTDRREVAKQKKLCFNCLKDNHLSSTCPSTQTCRTCKRTHHTLLHSGSEKRPAGSTSYGTTPKKRMRTTNADNITTQESNSS